MKVEVNPTYKNAQLVKYESGVWRIEWYNQNENGELERVRPTLDINRIKDLRERERLGNDLATLINQALAAGFNFLIPGASAPIPHADDNLLSVLKKVLESTTKDKLPGDSTDTAIDSMQTEKLLPLLRKALKAHNIGKKINSRDSNNSIANIFFTWLEEQNLNTISPAKFQSTHFEQYLFTRAQKSASNYNRHVMLIRNLFDRIKKIDKVITDNPIEGFPMRKETDSSLFETLTKEELQKISAYLREKNELEYLLFYRIIYYAYIRPGHIYLLKSRQIDYTNNRIRIEGKNTKNGRNSTKQLMLPLKKFLIELGYDKLQPETYLFSEDIRPGNNIRPGLYDILRKHWKAMTELLGINKKMYALKPTSGTLYIDENENVNIVWLKDQMEHGTLAQTETYVKERQTKTIDEENVNLPEF